MVESKILTDDDLCHLMIADLGVQIDKSEWVQDMQDSMNQKVTVMYDLNQYQILAPIACYVINRILLCLDGGNIDQAVQMASEHISETETGISMLKRIEHHPYYSEFYKKYKNI